MFCKVVAVAPAVVRRDGRVQAQGKPCDYARLGVEEHLDAPTRTRSGALARSVRAGREGLPTRLMTTAFALRAILLMTLMPRGLRRGDDRAGRGPGRGAVVQGLACAVGDRAFCLA